MRILQSAFRLPVPLLLLIQFSRPLLAQESDTFFLSADSLTKNGSIILHDFPWKYHSGNHAAWASPAFDDSDWTTLKPWLAWGSIPKGTWTGIGWFRLHFAADSTLQNQTLAIWMNHDGASEIYLDGRLIQRFGTVSASTALEKIYNPRHSLTGLHLDDKANHILAVRYSYLNAEINYSRYGWFADWPGFQIEVRELHSEINIKTAIIKIALIQVMGPLGIFAVLSLLHFMLFIFWSKEKSNFYFAIFSALLACFVFTASLSTYATLDIELSIWRALLIIVLPPLTVVSLLTLVYSLFYSRIPKWIWVFLSAAIFAIALSIWQPQYKDFVLLMYVVILFLESSRVIARAILKKQNGAWIIGVGVTISVLAFIIDSIGWLFHVYRPWAPPGSTFLDLLTHPTVPLNFASFLALPISMSILLARRFATTYQSLEQKVVKELEQERLVTERLRRVDKLKDEFLANTSHELRTPLHGILGLTESIVDTFEKDPPVKTRANLAMIIASGKRLASLVNDILDFSKLKRQDLQIQKKPLNLRVLTDLVLKFSVPLLAGKHLVLKNEVPPDFPPADGDENRLQQILHNLVGNAIKFTEQGVNAGIKFPTLAGL